MNGETVHTWADAFGAWHARITFPAPGYGPAHLRGEIRRIRAKARRAIRREILARERGPIRVRIEVTANDENSQGQMQSITFGERKS